ncbi:MAG: RecQ family ATP-dependent helicase [Chitinophagaceae bacterium]|nr:RecQ family ATP-dependent helicase [Chitinophagaceae bacterium]
MFFFPSKIIFKASQQDLRSFEESHENLSELTKTLLRTYQGIFDDHVNISERFLAKTLRLHDDQVIDQLKQIASFGILEYWPQKETPQVHFLYNRASARYLNIDHEVYLERKNIYKKRVEAMLSYLITTKCRMDFLIRYFGEDTGTSCGKCDNCFAKKREEMGSEEFDVLSQNIIRIAKSGISIADLQAQLPAFKRDRLMEVINYLTREKLISVGAAGMIFSQQKSL